jgi:hypothetical protein
VLGSSQACEVQVGSLKPDADPSLTAILTIQHPREEMTYEQGSFLSPREVLSLASMEQTAELKPVKAIIEQRLAEVCMHVASPPHRGPLNCSSAVRRINCLQAQNRIFPKQYQHACRGSVSKSTSCMNECTTQC